MSSVQITVSSGTSGVNQMTPQHESSLRRDLHKFVCSGNWDLAQSIYNEYPHLVTMELTVFGDIALHVAVERNKATFVEGLLGIMAPEDLEIRNLDGNTAFCIAAAAGNDGLLQIMLEKNDNLPLIRGSEGRLPIHLAASSGCRGTMQFLSSGNLLDSVDSNDIELLFFMTISNGLYDMATKLFKRCPAMLAVARDGPEQLTALHLLARKPPTEPDVEEWRLVGDRSELLQEVWSCIQELECSDILQLISDPSPLLIDAIESRNINFVLWLLKRNPELIAQKNSDGQNLLHAAVLHRQKRVVDFIAENGTSLIMRTVDKNSNNVLHLAAQIPQQDLSTENPRALLLREQRWFEEMKEKVPPELRRMRNSKGESPEDIFLAGQKELTQKAMVLAKGIAKVGIVLATTIITIASITAYTYHSEKVEAGTFEFIMSNLLALFLATASLLFFMTYFTSPWYPTYVFLFDRVSAGLTTLYISLAAVIFAANAASLVYIINTDKWGLFVYISVIVPFGALFDALLSCFAYYMAKWNL